MHELSIIKALLQQIEQYRNEKPSVEDASPERCNSKSIASITLEVGTMTCVDADRLKFSFDMVKEEARLSHTILNINTVLAQAKCKQCQKTFDLKQLGQACACGSYDYTLLSGQELNLIEIEFN